MGLAAGGLVVAIVGGVYGAIAGINALIFGMKASQMFALGAAVYDIVALTVAPILGITMELIEWGEAPYRFKREENSKNNSNSRLKKMDKTRVRIQEVDCSDRISRYLFGI